MRPFFSFLVVAVLIGCTTSRQPPTASAPRASTNEVASIPADATESGDTHGTRVVATPMQTVEEGVYFFRNGFSTLILELHDGRYRYWFSSDVITGDEPTYPLTGRYVAEGATIRLEHQQRHMQDRWTFRKLNDETTLWRPTAITWWRDKRAFDYYGVLYPTKLKPEDIWRKDVWKVKP
jgi:hypothetical protein